MENKEFEQFEIIEQYLQGQLKGKALAQFEASLKENSNLVREVELYKDMYKFGQSERAEIQELRAIQQKIKSEEKDKIVHHQESPKKKNANYFKRFAIAASILFLIGFAWFLYSGSLNNHETLYAKFAKHEPISLTTKSGSSEQNQLANLKKAFNNKKYQNFLKLSEQYLKNNPDNNDIFFAKGIAELETNKYNEALETFKSLKQEGLLSDKTDWYIALVYLKKNEIPSCQQVLNDIIKEKKFNKDNAKELLQKLK